jgi:hypothetical protein
VKNVVIYPPLPALFWKFGHVATTRYSIPGNDKGVTQYIVSNSHESILCQYAAAFIWTVISEGISSKLRIIHAGGNRSKNRQVLVGRPTYLGWLVGWLVAVLEMGRYIVPKLPFVPEFLTGTYQSTIHPFMFFHFFDGVYILAS